MKILPMNVILFFLSHSIFKLCSYKFVDSKFFCMNNVDVLLIDQKKLDSLFPEGQFSIDTYNKPLGLDVSGMSGGLSAYANSHVPTRQLTEIKIPIDIQIIIFESSLRKENWLVESLVYKPSTQTITYFLYWLSQIFDFQSITYKKKFMLGDFNPIQEHTP